MSGGPFPLAAGRAALLVVDLQNDFVRAGAPQEVPEARASLPLVAGLIAATRRAGRPVLYTRYTAGPVGTHQAWFSPECGPEQRSCWRGVERAYDDVAAHRFGHDVVDELTPAAGEVVVDKYGYGSFHNTLLDDALRAVHVSQVWVVGTVTQICVEQTVREGFARGYEMVVAADGVSSFAADLHAATLKNLAHKFALVVPTAELTAALQSVAGS